MGAKLLSPGLTVSGGCPVNRVRILGHRDADGRFADLHDSQPSARTRAELAAVVMCWADETGWLS